MTIPYNSDPREGDTYYDQNKGDVQTYEVRLERARNFGVKSAILTVLGVATVFAGFEMNDDSVLQLIGASSLFLGAVTFAEGLGDATALRRDREALVDTAIRFSNYYAGRLEELDGQEGLQ